MKKQDLTGNKYGKLTVIKMLYNYNNTAETKCLCNCDCGAKNVIRAAYRLKHSKLPSCGCAKKEVMKNTFGKNIEGLKFGRLTVIETLWKENPPKVRCKCDCGNIVILNKKDVQSNHTKSCGCITLDRLNIMNYVEHSGKISDYGVEIIKQSRRNTHNQWLWVCKCGYCGNLFEELPARVLSNHVRSCGCLVKSSYEKSIEKYLNELNVDYETQYTFNDCKSDNNYKLRFDFAIFKNNNLYCLLEYDGKQHFYPVDWFGGEESYKKNVQRDNIKNNYCKENKIPLYRFDYTQDIKQIKEEIANIIYP